jgi:hypothetical protein
MTLSLSLTQDACFTSFIHASNACFASTIGTNKATKLSKKSPNMYCKQIEIVPLPTLPIPGESISWKKTYVKTSHGTVSSRYRVCVRQPWGGSLLFATVPGSSVNSWDSWFIFNLRKINPVIIHAQLVHKKGQQLTMWGGRYIRIGTVDSVHLKHSFSASVLVLGLRPSLYDNAHISNNVHTWSSVFLRHLASTSFMVPFWAYTDSGSVPISGSPR